MKNQHEESEGVFVSVAVTFSLSTGKVKKIEDLGDRPEDDRAVEFFTNFLAERGLDYLKERGSFESEEEWER